MGEAKAVLNVIAMLQGKSRTIDQGRQFQALSTEQQKHLKALRAERGRMEKQISTSTQGQSRIRGSRSSRWRPSATRPSIPPRNYWGRSGPPSLTGARTGGGVNNRPNSKMAKMETATSTDTGGAEDQRDNRTWATKLSGRPSKGPWNDSPTRLCQEKHGRGSTSSAS